MKAIVTDDSLIASLRPLQIVNYLRSRDWARFDQIGDLATVWRLPEERRVPTELIVPIRQTVADFESRVADLIHALSVIEDRPMSDIVSDIMSSTTDIIRFRVEHSMAAPGTIPIEQGVQLVEGAHRILVAAASAAIAPDSVFPAKRRSVVTEYLRHLYLGPSESGSYVISVRCPVVQEFEQGQLFDDIEPLERRVTTTLARALSEVRRSVDEATATNDLRHFAESVSVGVSANLCDAVSSIFQNIDIRLFEVSISWSPGRSVPAHTPSRIALTPESAPVLQEAARFLRQRPAVEGVAITGYVVKLEKPVGWDRGIATIDGYFKGKWRKVRVELEKPEYERAVATHLAGHRITYRGVLAKQGTTYELRPEGASDGQVEGIRLGA